MSSSKEEKKAAENTAGQQELKKVSLHVNEFGDIVRDVKTDDINAFLDENVPDKKFLESDDLDAAVQ